LLLSWLLLLWRLDWCVVVLVVYRTTVSIFDDVWQ
jgi:hypothetical protein